MDTVYPEPLSRLYRRTIPKKRPKSGSSRYRTQPVTFSEIKEVDEDNIDESSDQRTSVESKSEIDINAKFEEFIKLRDLRFDKFDKNSSCTEEEQADSCDVKETLKSDTKQLFDSLRTCPSRYATNHNTLQEK